MGSTTKTRVDCLINITPENLPLVAKIVALHIGDRQWVLAAAKTARVSPIFVRRVAGVGFGTVHPELLWETGAGARTLRRMPLAIQQECLDCRTVALLIQTREGAWETIDVGPIRMSSRQAKQVFDLDRGVIRTVEEQRTWFEGGPWKRTLTPTKKRVRRR